MLKNTTICSVALAVSSAIALTACGGGGESGSSSSTAIASTYSYQNIASCADTDLDGSCSDYEKHVALTSGYSRMLNANGAILTSPAELSIISPFTTLLHSEMLYNPVTGGNIEKSKAYLQTVLGQYVDVDFTSVDVSHGPQQATNLLMASLKQAQIQGSSSSPMVNIAQALDAMIEHKTLDLSAIDLAAQTSRHVSFDGSLLIHGSQSDAGLAAMKSIALNPANSRIIYVDARDNVRELDTATKQSVAVGASSSSFSSRSISSYDDDEDEHDDDDHYGGNANRLPGYQQDTSNTLKEVIPALNSVQSYKLYEPNGIRNQSFVCNTTGGNGIFLTSLQDKTGNPNTNVASKTASRKLKIDAYGGASGSDLPVTLPSTPPTIPLSASSCYNDNFEWMHALYQQGIIIAKLDDGLNADGDQLRRLDATTLNMEPITYTLRSDEKTIIFSKDDNEILIISDNRQSPPKLVDTKTLTGRLALNVTDVLNASFAAGGQIVMALASENKVIWTDKSPNTQQLDSINLDGQAKLMDSSPNGKFTVVITATSVYLLDNIKREVTKQISFDASQTTNLFVQNDKAITVNRSGVDYFQFANISGPKLKVASQLVTKELLEEWEKTSTSHWNSTSLGYVLTQTGTPASAAQAFHGVTLDWSPSTATQASQITGVYISGTNRGDRVQLYKAL
ncbi:hypothetical protein L1D31_04695 [Vibrio sp. Isolate23]|uniref:hypothetical protein n=1 Tax=Vibrio sp. Isolate23 TaxID=2908533 RepID=UPI001EFE1E86|nr:hypothetical protein [Vibrio sp. Isolate23]MCG9681861.1 hypothetical protein [Vibrio sp. Isolate23]